MACSRFFGSFSRHRCNSRRMSEGVDLGRACQSGCRSRTAASVSVTVSPSNARRPVSISYSTQPNAQMSRALVHGVCLAPARGSCRRPCRGSCRRRSSSPAIVIVGEIVTRSATRRPSGSIAFARPKSSTFTVPSGAHLDVRRLQIAVDDPLLVRRLERLGDLPGDRQRLVDGNRPCAIRSASVGPSTSSITSAVMPVGSSPSRRSRAMFG